MIGHLINTDIGNRGIKRLYIEYRRKNFDFLKDAAKLFLDNYERTLIITGFPIPPTMRAETDGPSGAVALYYAVEKLGGRAEILTYPEIEEALRDLEVRFVKDPFIEGYSLIIAVETPGRAADGKCYSMSGLEIKRETFDWIVENARELGIPTIGIGDGGNEAGMGKIKDLIRKYVPHGERIGSTIETDELVLSAVSNWGAYGLIGEAALMEGELRDVLATINEEEILKSLTMHGVIDGVTKKTELSVDGIPKEIHSRFLRLLTSTVKFRSPRA
ncbi:MAG: DUF4392 domain-containing protein [Thermococcus sp.]|nr:DUF4392 domain-containing protein [Thermococcus sp.]